MYIIHFQQSHILCSESQQTFIQHLIPIALRSLFTKNSSIHNYNTRNSNKLRPALARHAYRDKDFRFISVHVWNYICDNVRIDVSFPSFKKSLKCFILSEKFSFKL